MLRSGLIGRAIALSRSPWLHEQEAKAQGLALSYELFDFSQRGWPDSHLAPLIRELREAGYAGLNVTYPFKQAIIPLLDDLAESAALVGAVNTLAMRDGQLVGHNTDMDGFRDSFLTELAGVATDRVLQLGAGGAGSAVANALLSSGVGTLELVDLDAKRVNALAAHLANTFGTHRVAITDVNAICTARVDGVVNTTPIGMAANPASPLPSDLIEKRHWVADIIYFPIETELLRTARNKGCRVLNGRGMVISQAARAFEIITGEAADQDRMASSFASA